MVRGWPAAGLVDAIAGRTAPRRPPGRLPGVAAGGQAGELDPDTPEPRFPTTWTALGVAGGVDQLPAGGPRPAAAAAEAGVEDAGEMERFRSWVERLPARGSSSGGCCAPPTIWTWRLARRCWASSVGHIRRWRPTRAAPSRSCSTAPRNGARNGSTSPSDRGSDPDGRRPPLDDPPEGFPAAVISRVIIHVDGSPGAG